MFAKIKNIFNIPYSIPVLLFVIAFLPRIFAINYGLPHLYLIDEEFFVEPALRVADGALNPGWFGAPGQTIIYICAALFQFVAWIIPFDGTITQQYLANPTAFQIAGRVVAAIAGALMAPVAYAIGKQWNKRTGVIAGILIAGSFFLIEHSHTIRPDIIQTFFLLCMVYFWMNIMKHPKKYLWYVACGIAWGLAFDTKYPALFFIVPLLYVLVVLWRQKKFEWKYWFLLFFSAALTTFLAGPFLYIDLVNVLADIQNEARSTHGSHAAFGFFGNLWWYTWHVLGWQLGTLLYALIVCWIGKLLYRIYTRQATQVEWIFSTVIVAAGSYVVLISALSLHWARWIIPVMTLLCIPAAIMLDWILQRSKKHIFLGILCLLIVLCAPAFRLVRTLYGFSQEHTIEVARQWIPEHIFTGSTIAVEPYAPDISEEYTVVHVPNMTYQSIAQYRQQGVEYFILTEPVYGTITQEYINPNNPLAKGAASAKQQYTRLLSHSQEVFAIHPNSDFTPNQLLYSNDFSVLRTWRVDMRMGPYIRVFRLLPKMK